MLRLIRHFTLPMALSALLGCTSSSEPQPKSVTGEGMTNSIGMELKLIPTGEFSMGSPDTKTRPIYVREKPQHRVRITRPFLLGVHPVTQEQYQKVMEENPSNFKGNPLHPVEVVSWFDAIEFCNRLSEQEGHKPYYKVDRETVTILDGDGYRLPTEAEWEYACRAGSPASYCFGDNAEELHYYAWFAENSNGETHPVGQKQPNAWGLYDIHGNVWEWCQDWYTADYYGQSPVSDPLGPSEGSRRVFRGGGWVFSAVSCRSAFRDGYAPDSRTNSLGFRVLRSYIK